MLAMSIGDVICNRKEGCVGMPILYVKDDIGNFISIPALKGDKGDKGDSGDGSGDMSKATYSPNFDGELSPKSHTHTASVITQDANNRFFNRCGKSKLEC